MASSHDRPAAEALSDSPEFDPAHSLAAAIDEQVMLHAPDPGWPASFERERDRLHAILPGAFVQIEHIGSTAVPGLVAKPVIDILAGVRSLEGVDDVVDRLCMQSYTTSKEFNATLPERRWLMRWKNGHRTHHLHIVAHAGPCWQDRLAFRDALRRDAALAGRYADLKMKLATLHRHDREAYTEAKAAFVQAAVGNPA
jgi:GrpB-like predicted nucleotidyltransferase (UPF0157 family)